MFRTLLILPLLLSASAAYTLPQSASSFAGRSVTVGAASTQQRHGTSATLEMKKGKSNVPPAMRNQYKKAQEMEAYRQQMMDSQVGSISTYLQLKRRETKRQYTDVIFNDAAGSIRSNFARTLSIEHLEFHKM